MGFGARYLKVPVLAPLLNRITFPKLHRSSCITQVALPKLHCQCAAI